MLTGATLNGRDLGARVAAKLGWAYAADCTDASAKDGAFEVKRPMYAGKVRATLRVPTAGGALDPPRRVDARERRGRGEADDRSRPTRARRS